MLTPLNTTSIDNSMGWLTKLQKSLKFFHATRAATLFIFILKFTCHTPCFSHQSTRCKASPTRAPSTAKKHYTFYKAPTTSKRLSTAKFYPFRAHRQIPANRLQSSIQPTVKASISHQMQSIYYQLLQTSQILSTMWKYGSTTHLPSTFL